MCTYHYNLDFPFHATFNRLKLSQCPVCKDFFSVRTLSLRDHKQNLSTHLLMRNLSRRGLPVAKTSSTDLSLCLPEEEMTASKQLY